MEKEKRKGDKRIPDNLDELLNKAQRQALPGILQSGWELQFLRRPLFQEPVVVLRHPDANRNGVLELDGRIDLKANIKVRDQDKQTRITRSDKPLVWTK